MRNTRTNHIKLFIYLFIYQNLYYLDEIYFTINLAIPIQKLRYSNLSQPLHN